jgi:hypothetical protein
MDINLYYKEYPVKMSLEAMKDFNSSTGMDLWCTLLKFRECFFLSVNEPIQTRLSRLNEVVDFHTGAKLIHAMVKTENKMIPLSEIEDAMFRCGWNFSDNENSQPWPLLVVKLANDIDHEFEQSTPKKKAVT